MKRKLLAYVAGALFFKAAWAATEATFIFVDAPFASAHASTVVELANKDLLSAWFGGSAEGKADVAIWSARLHAGKWSEPAELAREPGIATYNPVMFYTRDRRLWFYYKFGPHPTSWSAARRWSVDDGQTWSPVEHLPAGVTGPIRAKPLLMSDGTVVSGTSVESYHSWAVWVERSTDNGISWRRIGPITVPATTVDAGKSASSDPFQWADTYGIIQPSIVLLGGRHLRLYARSTGQIGRICVADSQDAGLTWTSARPIDVPNPNSGIDAVRLRDGKIALVYNDSTARRTPLKLAISDDGEHFTPIRTLESGAGEFSYPAMIVSQAGDLEITYTWNRKAIKYLHIPGAAIHASQTH